MEPRIEHFARIGAAAAVAGEAEVAREIRAAVEAGTQPAELHEILLQSYLFVGYPRAINALIAFHEAVPDVPAPAEDEPASLERWRERGGELCAQIYAGNYERLVGNIRALHPSLAEWMVTEGYGKVLSRPHLDARLRELAVLGILAATGQRRQLESHIRGALHVGASGPEIRLAISCGTDYSDAATSEVVHAQLDRVLASS